MLGAVHVSVDRIVYGVCKCGSCYSAILYCCRINDGTFIYSNNVYFIGGNNDDVRLFQETLCRRSVHSDLRTIVYVILFSYSYTICRMKMVRWCWFDCIMSWSMCWIRRCCSSKMHLIPYDRKATMTKVIAQYYMKSQQE